MDEFAADDIYGQCDYDEVLDCWIVCNHFIENQMINLDSQDDTSRYAQMLKSALLIEMYGDSIELEPEQYLATSEYAILKSMILEELFVYILKKSRKIL